MTRPNEYSIEHYVLSVRDAMGLGHWRIVIDSNEPEHEEGSTILGETRVEHYGYRAIMRLATSIFDDPDDVRRVVVHELTHLFLEHWAMDLDDSRGAALTPAHADMLEKGYERGIEGITSALAPFMPAWSDS